MPKPRTRGPRAESPLVRSLWTLVALPAVALLLTACAPGAGTPTGTGMPPTAGTPRTASTPTVSSTPTLGGGLPEPVAGQRWESMLDAVVQVPQAWGYGFAPDNPWPWCMGGRTPGGTVPTAPYVGLSPLGMAVPAIGCPQSGIPEAMQVEHLEWTPARPDTPTEERTINGWVYSSKVVGSARLTYVHRPDADAQSILGTTRVVTTNPLGCPVTVPGGASEAARPTPARLSGEASGAVICQYYGLDHGPNLVASTRVDGAAALGLLTAIEGSPVVGAPRFQPASQCAPGIRDRTRVLLRFESGEARRDAWLTFGGCRLPDIDDGATYRVPTRDACRATAVTPVEYWAINGREAALTCGPDSMAAGIPAVTPTPSTR